MKTAFVTIALILIAIGAYYVFLNVRNPAVDESLPDESAPEAVTAEGSVIAVDRDQMASDGPALITVLDNNGNEITIAVPSMGLPLCAAAAQITNVAVIDIGDLLSVRGTMDANGRIVPCDDAAHYLEVMSRVENSTYGYTYIYTKGPDGYVRLEDTAQDSSTYRGGSLIFNAAEYAAFEQSTDAREGPPAIRVSVYENVNSLSASVWAMRNDRITNVEMAFNEPEEAVVGGANAVHFVTDGLWPTDTYIVASGGYIYVLAGMYTEESDAIHTEFESILNSFTFIPTAAQVGATTAAFPG